MSVSLVSLESASSLRLSSSGELGEAPPLPAPPAPPFPLLRWLTLRRCTSPSGRSMAGGGRSAPRPQKPLGPRQSTIGARVPPFRCRESLHTKTRPPRMHTLTHDGHSCSVDSTLLGFRFFGFSGFRSCALWSAAVGGFFSKMGLRCEGARVRFPVVERARFVGCRSVAFCSCGCFENLDRGGFVWECGA